MLSSGLNALRMLQSVGAVKVRSVTGKLITISRARGEILKIRGVREYTDGRAREFEELRLAKLFHRYLKMYIREKLLKIPANSPFTVNQKGRNHPLAWTGDMLNKFVYIRKMSAGYRVGFQTSAKYNSKFTLGQLLHILEYGTLLSVDGEVKDKMRKFIWANIKDKKMVNIVKPSPEYRIPPRPFFNDIVTKFITHNKGERRDFNKGYYALHIVVRKPTIRRPASSEPIVESEPAKKSVKIPFTELYG